jgi:hypothetical protein
MTRKIGRENREAMVRKIACLLRPDAVIHAGAVDKDDAGPAGVERPAARCRKDSCLIDAKPHGI